MPICKSARTVRRSLGSGLTAEKMKSCVWLKPTVVVRIDFAEWTGANKLRHTKFIGLREDKNPRKVVRET